METHTRASERTYFALVATQTLSLIGSNVSAFAVSIWLFERTGAATPLTLVGTFFVLAQIFATGIGGALADRYDRRLVMLCADTGVALASVALLVSFSSGAFELWHLYGVVIVQALFGAIQQPAFTASVTMLVPDEHRDRANAIQQLSGPAAGIIAPPLAGLMYASTGVVGAILIDLATFALASAVLIALQIPRPPARTDAPRHGLLRQTLDGFPYLVARPTLLALSVYIAAVNFLAGFVSILITPYGLARTGSAAAVGFVAGAASAGAIAGGLIVARWGGTRPRIHGVMMSAVAFGVFVALVGAGRDAWSLGIGWFLLGLSEPFVVAPIMSLFQMKIAPDIQGRVFAAMGQINMAFIPLAFLLSGQLADRVFEPIVGTDAWTLVAPLVGNAPGAGIGAMFVLTGVSITLVTLVAYAFPSFRRIEAILPDHATTLVASQSPEASR